MAEHIKTNTLLSERYSERSLVFNANIRKNLSKDVSTKHSTQEARKENHRKQISKAKKNAELINTIA